MTVSIKPADYRLNKKLLSTEMDFWRKTARTSRILKVRNEIIRENGSNTILEIMENNMSKWYGHVLPVEDNRWLKRIMTWSPEGRRSRRHEMKWEGEVGRVMKQKI
jgi:recombinational DNA repair ATPase RecF